MTDLEKKNAILDYLQGLSETDFLKILGTQSDIILQTMLQNIVSQWNADQIETNAKIDSINASLASLQDVSLNATSVNP